MDDQKRPMKKTTENHSVDTRCKILFSQPEIIEDLVRHAMSEELADKLDFSTFKAEPTHWVSSRMKHTRSSDSVFSLNFKTGEPVFLILMIEFQSRPDAYMAMRSALYTLLFYESLTKKKNHHLMIDGKLPAVLPVVLYSGDAAWNSPEELFELIALPTAHALARYQPKQQFFLVNEKEIKEKMKASFIRALFKLEFIKNEDELDPFLAEMAPFFKRLSASRRRIIKEMFADYLGGLLSENGIQASVSMLSTLLESPHMLAENLKKVFKKKEQEYLKKGEQIGIVKGIAKGKKEAKAEAKAAITSLLVHILEQNFKVKPLPAWALKAVKEAPPAKIKKWAASKPEGKTLEEFLK
jgi:predicted transposase/invertase (TIGR01784 family)